jgi:hypothetical protein
VEPSIADELRPTEDVDCVIEASSLLNYNKVEKILREKGFSNDTRRNAPIAPVKSNCTNCTDLVGLHQHYVLYHPEVSSIGQNKQNLGLNCLIKPLVQIQLPQPKIQV